MRNFIVAFVWTVLAVFSTSAFAGDTVISLSYGGISRSSILYVPANYNSAKAYPLILAFHGSGGTGAEMENITAFDALADQYGFLVAYPESNGSNWVITGTNNDVGFATALLPAIEASYHVDPTRVYAAGYSQGATLSHQIGFCQGNLVAGIGNAAMDLWTASQTCKPSPTLLYVKFHGTADPVIPYTGLVGPSQTSLSAPATAQFLAQVDNCANQSSPTTTYFPDTLNNGSSQTDFKSIWPSCPNGVSVTFYSITGGGHTWPGGTQRSDSTMGLTSQGVNASQILWTAFSTRKNPNAFAGVCGAANNVSTSVAPSTGLCRIGVSTSVSGLGPWYWTCPGYNGGASASCSAPKK